MLQSMFQNAMLLTLYNTGHLKNKKNQNLTFKLPALTGHFLNNNKSVLIDDGEKLSLFLISSRPGFIENKLQ